jgi:23S rRNA (guanine745-N1)-methyltransferase
MRGTAHLAFCVSALTHFRNTAFRIFAFLPFVIRIPAFLHSCISAFLHYCFHSVFPPLSCPVRGCHERLHRAGRSFACPRGHSHDIARSGYVNLLQPQDRRSLQAGDSRAAVESRAELIEAGVGRATIDAVVASAQSLIGSRSDAVVVELGSGSGETVGLLCAGRATCGIGIDLSTHAAAFAARRFPSVTWVVANADRRLPLMDRSVDLVLSVHARRNPSECRRVLRPDGHLLVAIPGARDLIELRETVQGEAVARDRTPQLIGDHDEHFDVVNRTSTTVCVTLARDALLKLLRGTYRGERLSESTRVDRLDRLEVTLASKIVLFAPRSEQ